MHPTMNSAKRGRWAFKKGRSSDGLMRLAPTYRLTKAGVELAILQCFDQYPDAASKWFWYGDGVNTCDVPMSLDDCKASALNHFKAKE